MDVNKKKLLENKYQFKTNYVNNFKKFKEDILEKK